jgi:hypothetical protein
MDKTFTFASITNVPGRRVLGSSDVSSWRACSTRPRLLRQMATVGWSGPRVPPDDGQVGAVRWTTAVPLPEPIWVRTESQEPAMTHFGREPVMATSSSASLAAVTRRREYGELVQEPVAPPG